MLTTKRHPARKVGAPAWNGGGLRARVLVKDPSAAPPTWGQRAQRWSGAHAHHKAG